MTGEAFSVNFSPRVYKELQDIAEKRGMSVTEVLEEAIGLERWYQRMIEQGNIIMADGEDGLVWEFKQKPKLGY